MGNQFLSFPTKMSDIIQKGAFFSPADFSNIPVSLVHSQAFDAQVDLCF